MSARDELAATIEGALDRSHGIIAWTGAAQEDIADAILAAGYRKPRTISTTEEVDALPNKAIVMTCFGDAVTVYRSSRIPAERYHFLISDGTSATVLHEGPGSE